MKKNNRNKSHRMGRFLKHAEFPVNREHKDVLFRYLFRERGQLLSLYNALNGTDYQDADALEINTLEDVIYLGMKNDLSFILGSSMSLYEHQSTWNENMPLRGLFYFAELYEQYVKENNYHPSSSGKRIPLPFPKFVVFYNGARKQPDRTELRLSDAFLKPEREETPALECRATVLNVNYGHNQELLQRCRRLSDYSAFIEEIRSGMQTGLSLEAAVESAISACLSQGILSDVLSRSRLEVRKMLLTEYDEKAEHAYIRKEALEEGLERGRSEGIRALVEVYKKLGGSRSEAEAELAERFHLSADEASRKISEYWPL